MYLANVVFRLVDDNGVDITDFDVRGELCIRGPTVIRGYFNNAKANKESWDEEGYFHTGDIMYLDGKSKLWYIVDRKKVRPVASSNPCIWDCPCQIGSLQDQEAIANGRMLTKSTCRS